MVNVDDSKWNVFISTNAMTEQDSERIIIEEVRNRKHLYDAHHIAYMDKEAARLSYEAIAQILGPGWTGDQVKGKIRSLRVRYTRCLRDHLRSVRNSGTSTNGIKAIKWKWFQEMDSFLRPHVQLRKSVVTLPDREFEEDELNVTEEIHNLLHQTQEAVAQDDWEAAEEDCDLSQSPASTSASATSSSIPRSLDTYPVETVPPEPTPVAQLVPASCAASPFECSSCSKKRKRNSASEAVNVVDMSVGSNSDESIFGEFVARELEKLPLRVRRTAKFEIHKILYESGQ